MNNGGHPEQPVKNHRKIFLCLIGFISVALGLLLSVDLRHWATDPRFPKGAEARWSDGASITLLRSEYTTKIDFRRSAGLPNLLAMKYPRCRGNDQFTVTSNYRGIGFAGSELSTKNRRWMMVARFRGPNDEPWNMPSFDNIDGRPTPPHSGGPQPPNPMGESEIPSPIACALEDGAGGWIPLTGPIMPNNVDDRAFLLCDCFPHNLPTLKLRFTRADFPPLELEVKNPDYRTTPATWVSDHLPATKSFPEADVTLQEVSLRHPEDQIWLLDARLHFVSKDQPSEYFNRRQLRAEDEWGNQMELRFISNQMGYPVLPSAKRIRISYAFERSDRYPWRMSDTVIIGEGIWPSSGSAPSVKLTSAGAKLGLYAISIPRVHGETSFDLEIKGRIPEKDWASFQRDFGQIRFAGIYTTGPELAARCQLAGGSSTNDGAEVSFTSAWKVEGKIETGKPIQIGLCQVPPPTVVHFIADVPHKASP